MAHGDCCDHDHDHEDAEPEHLHHGAPGQGPPNGATSNGQAPMAPPAPTEEQMALSDANFTPVEFTIDEKTGTIKSPTHNLNLLNALSKSIAAIPPQLGIPPPPNVIPPQRTMAINQAKEQGKVAFKEGRYVDAIKLFTLAVDVAASRPLWEASGLGRDELAVCLANRSAAFAAVEDWVDSLVDAEAVVKLKKGWLKGYYRQGNALVKLGRKEEARDVYMLGLQFDPESTDLLEALSKIPSS